MDAVPGHCASDAHLVTDVVLDRVLVVDLVDLGSDHEDGRGSTLDALLGTGDVLFRGVDVLGENIESEMVPFTVSGAANAVAAENDRNKAAVARVFLVMGGSCRAMVLLR